jgi:hypothetical protein
MKSLIIGLAAATVFACGASAQEATRYAVPLPHGRCMIVAMTPKTASGTEIIPFGVTFKKLPVVVVTPTWIGSDHSVQSIETVVDLTLDHFSDLSGSGLASNYYVSWTAVGILKASLCV